MLLLLLCVLVVLAGDKCNKNPKATRIIPIVSYYGHTQGGEKESLTGVKGTTVDSGRVFFGAV